MRHALVILCLLGALLAAGCDGAPAPTVGLRVAVTVAPLRGLVEPLLPEGSEVRVLVRPGMSCHGYEPTPGDIVAMDGADLVFYVGLGLETAVEEHLRKHPRLGRQTLCFADAVGIAAESHDSHEHDETCDHAVDPHLWVDAGLVEEVVPAIAVAVRGAMEARGMLDAPARGRLAAAEAALLARVAEADADVRERLAPVAGRALVTHHAAFERFAERYGLRVAAVIQPFATEEPTATEVVAAVEAVRREGARAIFVEPQYSRAVAERIAEASGARLGRLDALGNGDWFALMRSNAGEIARMLRDEP